MNTSTITKPWIIVAYDNYYPDSDLNNIVAAYETEKEANENLVRYSRSYDNAEVINIVDYMNETFK